jgi:hypothetical protein
MLFLNNLIVLDSYFLNSAVEKSNRLLCLLIRILPHHYCKEYIYLTKCVSKEKYEINSLHVTSCYDFICKIIFVVRLSTNQYKSIVHSQLLLNNNESIKHIWYRHDGENGQISNKMFIQLA